MGRGARTVALVAAAVVVLGAAIAAAVSLLGTPQKYLTAYFPQAIGIYNDSSVRILGVPVGSVTKIVDVGSQVKVTMAYNAQYQLPADVDAVIVAPSVVSDRYIQLAPVYTGGPPLGDHAVLPASRTAVPVELDQIFRDLNSLNVALGPKGANKNGALSRLVRVGAANLRGNGTRFNQAINEFSQAIGTLSNSRGNLFGTLRNLESFTATLAHDNGGVIAVTHQLAQVSTQLDDERGQLGLALHNLAIALGEVQGFVKDNRAALTRDISGLTTVTSALLTQKRSIVEFLDDAPTALANLALTYDPASHTLRTRDNGNEGFTQLVCTLESALGQACSSSTPGPPGLPGGSGRPSTAPSLPSAPGVLANPSGTLGKAQRSVQRTLQQLFGGGL
jgi:phospholipid/cholesterol/gamma-HCH transport system substrate-binding protein